MPEQTLYSHVVIHGVGLIGGSIAAAVRERFEDCRVTGIGRNPQRLQAAVDAGLLHDHADCIDNIMIADDAVVVICLPVDYIAEAVNRVIAATTDGVLVTDAGSVKQAIQTQLSDESRQRFVGAHPIAGSEKTGFEHASADLYLNRPCIVTKSDAGNDLENRCCRFWSDLGATVSTMTAQQHDQILARTSHLPHLLAAVGALCTSGETLPFASTGFRDTTRVAAGDPSLWQQILHNNPNEVVAAITEAQEALNRLRSAVERNDRNATEQLLQEAAERRRSLSAD